MYMDSSSGQQQEMSQHSLENMLVNSNTQQQQEGDLKKPRPQPEQALKCPRCDSTNTKFCYYNNYSLSQPRYFCKSCRRYWTKGGTLRNVPVGGGCRKNKRSSSSKRSSQDQQPLTPNHNNPLTNLSSSHYDSNDLTLAFARLQQKQQSCGHLGFDDHHQHDFSLLGNSSNTSCEILGNPIANYNNPGFIDSLRNGFIESHSNFQNFQYGFGNGNAGEVENGSVGVRGEIGLGYDQEINNVKQEFCNGRENDENRVLWGFPNWQLNGETNNLGNFENGREGWNGIASSSWHGLLNSTPLM